MGVDVPRYLHIRSEHGYTPNPLQALPDEPEAVPADVQARLSRAAHERERDRERAEWGAIFAALQEQVAALRAASFAPAAADEIRGLGRALDRLHERLRRR